MLTVNQVEKYIGGRTLLGGVSFQLRQGERATLVGANGTGKSTLLKICAGQLSADGGDIAVPKDLSIGYLPQHAELTSSRTLRQELRHVFEEVLSHEAELETLAHRMGELDHESEEYEKVADRFGHLQHELERLNAYEMDANIGRITAGLGFNFEDLDRPCTEFSGGWRMRILLARLLLHNHDVLLLDEPTNHLDLETMIWLEDWIRASDATVLMVSHERAFMDRLAERVLEIHEGAITIYRGNYSRYLELRSERWEQWAREYANQQEEIRKTQLFIDRFRYKATKAVQVQSRVKMLEKIEVIPPPPSEPSSIHFRFPDCDRGSKEVFVGKDLRMAFGDLEVFADAEFSIWRGDRVALVGLNGAGKSTLLKMMIDQIKPTEGELVKGKATTTEYFAQYDEEGLHPNNTVWGEVTSGLPPGSAEQARGLLGGFFFGGQDVEKRINVLSGGERTRVRLAKMLFSGANTLLLDEPTNHLDLASRRTLEDAMCNFPGTLIFVSHDRVFLDRVPTRIFEIKDGQLRCFAGNYRDYCRALASMGEQSPLIDREELQNQTEAAQKGLTPQRPTKSPAATRVETEPVPEQSLSREEQKELKRERRKLERQLKETEEQIAKTEKQIKAIEEQMFSPEVYTNPTRCGELNREMQTLKDAVASHYEEWEALQLQLEED